MIGTGESARGAHHVQVAVILGDDHVTLLDDVEQVAVGPLPNDLLARAEAHLLQRIRDLGALARPHFCEGLHLHNE